MHQEELSGSRMMDIRVDERALKWSWACRVLDKFYFNLKGSEKDPNVGDVGVFRIKKIGYHRNIVCADNKKLRIYRGEQVVGIFGNRYATDALEGEVLGLDNLSMLSAAGMVGTVKSKHHEFGKTTDVEFVGYLSDDQGSRLNLKHLKFNRRDEIIKPEHLIIVIGTGMNSGKTTSARLLIRALSERNVRVAACKLTGSISNRDQDEMRSAAAAVTLDFSDYGFPSTYLCSKNELLELFNTMIYDLADAEPDVIVMEIADGVLQRETAMLLQDPFIRDVAEGIILSADSSTSALYASELLKKWGHRVVGVTGSITSAPLFIKEFGRICEIPILTSYNSGNRLADAIIKFLQLRSKNEQ
jgi:hypothetical protein